MIEDELKHVIFGEPFQLSETFCVRNPLLEEIMQFGEEKYWKVISTLVSRPYDAMVKLDDMGINYQNVSDYTFFLMQAVHLTREETEIIFGDFSFQDCILMASDEKNGSSETILVNESGKIVFDNLTYNRMVQYIRYIHFIAEKVEFDVGNEVSRQHLLKRMRRKQEREARRKKPFESILSDMVSSIVNLPGANYTYESVKKMHISQLYDSYARSYRILNYNQTMSGVYAGTVSYKDLDKSVLEWSGKIHKMD